MNAPTTTKVSPVVETWVRQLLDDPQIAAAIALAGEGRVQVTFYANGGKCNKPPAITINAIS